MSRLLIKNIGALYSLVGMTGTRGGDAAAIQPVEDGEVLVEDGRVVYAGPRRQPDPPDIPLAEPARHLNPYPPPPLVTRSEQDLTVIDARQALVTPGLVEPHTHIVYGGDRSHELGLKLRGVPYLEILAKGGGILSTVRATRVASDEELVESAEIRLRELSRHGVTTVEIKSGYGLDTAQELRLLRIIQALGRGMPLRVVPTFMGAHAIPPDFASDADGYVDEVIERMLPAVAEAGLADFCDVFCEHGVFSVGQSRRILLAGSARGLRPKVHADEIEPIGGAELAADVRAVSAEHLRASSDAGLGSMASAGVTPVLLPATSFNLRDHRFAPARRMIDEFDLPVALSTDANPGTSPTESSQLVMNVAALEMRLTPEEILAGMTINAARAIALESEVGSLEPGKAGDVVVWQAYELAMLPYRTGANQAAMVIQSGQIL